MGQLLGLVCIAIASWQAYVLHLTWSHTLQQLSCEEATNIAATVANYVALMLSIAALKAAVHVSATTS